MLTLSERFDAAESLLENGRWEEAQYLLDEILTVKPDHAGALNARGAAYLNAGDIESGERLIREAEAMEPQNPAIMGNLSSLAQIRGEVEVAAGYAERAFELSDDPNSYARLLGTMYLSLGRLDDAQKVLGRAVVDRRDDPNLLAALAETEIARGESSRAFPLLKRALELEEDNVDALIAMARLCSVTDAPDAAVYHAKKAHLVAPRNPLAALMLGGTLHQAGELNAAMEIVDRLLKAQPRLDPAHHLRAHILIDQGHGNRAIADLANRLRETKSNPQALLALADTMALAGCWEELITLAKRIPKQSDEQGAYRLLHANALMALGRLKEACDLLLAETEAPKRPLDPAAPKVCQLTPAPSPMGAMVLARAAVEWACDGPVRLLCPEVLAPAFGRLGQEGQIVIEADSASEVSDEIPALATIAADLWHENGNSAFQPYLRTSVSGVARWRAALEGKPKPWIGVFWDARAPGLPIDLLKGGVEDIPGSIISLQYDDARHQLRIWPEAIDAGVALTDLADLVDLIACLDRVVGPNGWPIHIAGARGVPGTVLLPENHDWYWHGDGETSTWYPSIRRILKPAGPNWAPAIAELSDDLRRSDGD